MENEINKTIELLKIQKTNLIKEIENNKDDNERNINYIKNITHLIQESQKYFNLLNQKNKE